MRYMNKEFYAMVSAGNEEVGMPRPLAPTDSRNKLFLGGFKTFNSGYEAAQWLYNALRGGYTSPASDELDNLAEAGDFDAFLAEFERENARNVEERINPFLDRKAQIL